MTLPNIGAADRLDYHRGITVKAYSWIIIFISIQIVLYTRDHRPSSILITLFDIVHP